jgi:hypothetical protein
MQQAGVANQESLQGLENRLLEMERLLIQMNERQRLESGSNDDLKEDVRRDITEFSARLLRELEDIEEELNETNDRLDRLNVQGNQVPAAPQNNRNNSPVEGNTNAVDDGNVSWEGVSRDEIKPRTGGQFLAADSSKVSKVTYTGMSGFAGFNIGKGRNNTFNFGLRWHYKTGIGSLEFMPEAFFGLGTPSNFGLMANIIQPIKVSSLGLITPYIGTGFGFMQIGSDGEDKLNTAFNIILGAYLNVGGGRLYVDLTGRNLFKNNQLIAGYRFNF